MVERTCTKIITPPQIIHDVLPVIKSLRTLTCGGGGCGRTFGVLFKVEKDFLGAGFSRPRGAGFGAGCFWTAAPERALASESSLLLNPVREREGERKGGRKEGREGERGRKLQE